MPKTQNEPKNAPPVHEVRIGLIKAAIWANNTEDGLWHNVTFERSYRDGEEWKSTTSFGRDDLLVLAKVADMAHSWILNPDKAAAPKPDLSRSRMPKAA